MTAIQAIAQSGIWSAVGWVWRPTPTGRRVGGTNRLLPICGRRSSGRRPVPLSRKEKNKPRMSWSGIAATEEKANRSGAERAEKTQRFGTRNNAGGLHELLLPPKDAPRRGAQKLVPSTRRPCGASRIRVRRYGRKHTSLFLQSMHSPGISRIRRLTVCRCK